MPEVRLQEPYSNPIAPPDSEPHHSSDRMGNLTNDDFRKLMMTPRPTPVVSTAAAASAPKAKAEPSSRKEKSADEERKKKKNYYMKPKKEPVEEEPLPEWVAKYRDRARERRDKQSDFPTADDSLPSTSGYRAVAPNADPYVTAQRRKQAIQESKFLGGDMEHTHLVKGLDFALLQKVRSEIDYQEEEAHMRKRAERRREREREKARAAEAEQDVTFKSMLAKNIYRIVFQSKPPEKNELFLPGRMAYVFELDDEYAESDIPTTLLRSKADCPTLESHTTLTTNDIVINKLTQILSYLRHGTSKRSKKKDRTAGKARDKDEEFMLPMKVKPKIEDSIFPGAGEYVPERRPTAVATEAAAATAFFPGPSSSSAGSGSGSGSGFTREHKVASYFDSRGSEPEKEPSQSDIRKAAVEFVKNVSKRYSVPTSEDNLMDTDLPDWSGSATAPDPKQSMMGLSSGGGGGGGGGAFLGPPLPPTAEGPPPPPPPPPHQQQQQSRKSSKQAAGFGGFSSEEHYAECYPGFAEYVDATYDSDDEADYTKMDLGSRKGPVRRWDFDTEEEYSKYQSNREALPKAAFQYGVKMSEGRKTRRYPVQNDKAKEKAKLNRQWQQINQIIQKRKGAPVDDGSSKKAKIE